MLPFWDLVKENTLFVWNESLVKAFQQSKQIIVSLVKKGSYHLWHQQGNLPSPRLEQGTHGLPIIAEVLHVPHQKSASVLFQWMAHCICRWQILHQCRVLVCTYWRRSSSNCLGTWEVTNIHHLLPTNDSSYR